VSRPAPNSERPSWPHLLQAGGREVGDPRRIREAEREIGIALYLRRGTSDRVRQSQRLILCANRVVTGRRQPVATTRKIHQPSTG
jgi:hypothetical protein